MRTFGQLALVVVLCVGPLHAADPAVDFRPDPLSVQRSGKGYRYPQAGWIVLHIEGEPYERGEQHGRLLAPVMASGYRPMTPQQIARRARQTFRVSPSGASNSQRGDGLAVQDRRRGCGWIHQVTQVGRQHQGAAQRRR